MNSTGSVPTIVDVQLDTEPWFDDSVRGFYATVKLSDGRTGFGSSISGRSVPSKQEAIDRAYQNALTKGL